MNTKSLAFLITEFVMALRSSTLTQSLSKRANAPIFVKAVGLGRKIMKAKHPELTVLWVSCLAESAAS